ncbi:MAG: nucleotidyltransferase domain-containing protein [Cyanobacteria bacterium]|nr:nucleotidyltransferase domain-containing protein [Cyanobacteriota bacterium]
MPVPSPSGSALRWPAAAEVLAQAASWAAKQKQGYPDLLAVGVFGSYGRGTAGVGSDLDLLLVLRHCNDPAISWFTASASGTPCPSGTRGLQRR